MNTSLVKIIDSNKAERAIILWLNEKGSRITNTYSITYWDWGRPFYAVIVDVIGFEISGRLGFNVYADGGEIKLISIERAEVI